MDAAQHHNGRFGLKRFDPACWIKQHHGNRGVLAARPGDAHTHRYQVRVACQHSSGDITNDSTEQRNVALVHIPPMITQLSGKLRATLRTGTDSYAGVGENVAELTQTGEPFGNVGVCRIKFADLQEVAARVRQCPRSLVEISQRVPEPRVMFLGPLPVLHFFLE